MRMVKQGMLPVIGRTKSRFPHTFNLNLVYRCYSSGTLKTLDAAEFKFMELKMEFNTFYLFGIVLKFESLKFISRIPGLLLIILRLLGKLLGKVRNGYV